MNQYYVVVEQGGPDQWEPITGFDVDNPDLVVWEPSERLTRTEAQERKDALVERYPDRNFKITETQTPPVQNHG